MVLVLLQLLLLLVVLLAMLLAISGPGKAGGISRRLINIIMKAMIFVCFGGPDSEGGHVVCFNRYDEHKYIPSL